MNPSDDTDLFEVVVYDSMLGSFDVGTLLAGETVYLDPISLPAPDDEGTGVLINIATAKGWDALGKVAESSDSWIVDMLHPDIAVDITADKSCAEVGEKVVYTIYVGNPSWDTTMYATVEDPLLGIDELLTLAAGRLMDSSPSSTSSRLGDPDPLVNKVSVMAVDYQNHFIWANDTWTVEIYHPMIEITKEADKELRRGRRDGHLTGSP